MVVDNRAVSHTGSVPVGSAGRHQRRSRRVITYPIRLQGYSIFWRRTSSPKCFAPNQGVKDQNYRSKCCRPFQQQHEHRLKTLAFGRWQARANPPREETSCSSAASSLFAGARGRMAYLALKPRKSNSRAAVCHRDFHLLGPHRLLVDRIVTGLPSRFSEMPRSLSISCTRSAIYGDRFPCRPAPPQLEHLRRGRGQAGRGRTGPQRSYGCGPGRRAPQASF